MFHCHFCLTESVVNLPGAETLRQDTPTLKKPLILEKKLFLSSQMLIFFLSEVSRMKHQGLPNAKTTISKGTSDPRVAVH